MADTAVAITAGTGTNIDTRTEATNGNHRQVVVLGDPATNAGVAPVDGTTGLKVDLGADNDVTATQTGTWTVQPGNTPNTSPWLMTLHDGSNPAVYLADNTDAVAASATANKVGVSSRNMAWGSAAAAWHRQRTVENATDSTGVGITAAGVIGQFDDVSPGTVTENRFGNIRMSVRREMYNQIRDAAGNERGLNIGASGDASVTVVSALPAGANAIGKLAANSGVDIGDVDVTSAVITGGAIAHDAADSGNPIKTGGRAISAEITAVSNNDRSDFITDLVGKQITLPYANPENFVSGAITTAMTSTTSTSLVAAPAAGLRNYITQITVSCAHATQGTDVVIQDGSGGTTLYTVPAAALYGGATLTFPVALRQPTTATAIYCANVTTGSSIKISASGYKGA